MVLTCIKRLLMKLLGLSMLSLIALPIQGHPGRTDSGGCHAGKLPRHCHDGARSGGPAQGHQSAPVKETGRSALRTTASEDDYNRWFCALVNGETDTRHGYTSAGGRGYVEVDCETGTMVYEGGLDKRSSLDSVQQALFFSHVTGKRPVVVIYDTDGREGRFEYRIRIACRKAGVRYEVFREDANRVRSHNAHWKGTEFNSAPVTTRVYVEPTRDITQRM